MQENIHRLRSYYNHLVKIQDEGNNLLLENSLDPSLFTRLIERYFQVMVDDIKGIDSEYGLFMGVYTTRYSIFKEDNKLTFLSNFIGFEFSNKIHEHIKTRNIIVHSPWLTEFQELKSRFDQLMLCGESLVDFLLRNWICQQCQTPIMLDENVNLGQAEKIFCPQCKGVNTVVSIEPLILEPI